MTMQCKCYSYYDKERQKAIFPKESVENEDLYNLVLNKIMTTHAQCVQWNFVASLKAHSKVWDNFCQLKAFKYDAKCFLFHL